MTYCTQAEYEAYAAARGITVKTHTLPADLILATDFIDTYYTFKGAPLSDTQPNKLPTDQVSVAAINKAALKVVELQQAGRLALDTATMTGALIESQEKVLEGVGSTSVTYAAGSQPTWKARTPELDMLLRPFTLGGSGIRRV